MSKSSWRLSTVEDMSAIKPTAKSVGNGHDWRPMWKRRAGIQQMVKVTWKNHEGARMIQRTMNLQMLEDEY